MNKNLYTNKCFLSRLLTFPVTLCVHSCALSQTFFFQPPGGLDSPLSSLSVWKAHIPFLTLNRAVWYRKWFQQCLAGQSPVKLQLLFHFREFIQCFIAAGHNFAFYVGKTTKPFHPCFSRCLCSDYLCTPAILIKTPWPWPANAPTSTWWKSSSSEITLMFTEAV